MSLHAHKVCAPMIVGQQRSGLTLLSSTGAVEGAATHRGLPNRHPCVRRRARLTVKLDADKAKASLDDPALIIDAVGQDRLIVSGDTHRDGSSLLNLCIGPNPLRLPALPPVRSGHSVPAVRQKFHLSPCSDFRGQL